MAREQRPAEPERERVPADEVEEASVESFPASDPPSFTPVTGSGTPDPATESEAPASAGPDETRDTE